MADDSKSAIGMMMFAKLFSTLGKPVSIMILVIAAIIVSLAVMGVINLTSPEEKLADELIKAETGIDLEKVEEDLISKK